MTTVPVRVVSCLRVVGVVEGRGRDVSCPGLVALRKRNLGQL